MITIGIGKNLKVAPSGSTPTANEPEVDTYISGLTTSLSSAQIARLNIFVYCLKNGLGISALSEVFDVLYILAGETQESSLRNLIKRAHDADNISATVWTQYEGFTGDGAADYLDTNFKDSQGVNFLSASYDYMMGAYCRSGSYGSKSIIGTRNTTNIYNMIYNTALNSIVYTPHAAASLTGNFNDTSYPRLVSTGRNSDSNNSICHLKNKTETGSDTDAAVFNSAGTHNYFLLAANNKGAGPVVLWDGQISLGYLAKYLTSAQHTILWTCFLAYMNANGKDT